MYQVRSQKGAERKQAILEFLTENHKMTQIQLMKEMDLTRKQIQKAIKKLQENGVNEREGSNRNGHWVIKKYGEQ